MLKKNGLMLIIIPNLIGSQKKVFSSQRWISVPTPLHGDEWIFGMKHISLDMLYRSAESCDITSLKITPVGGFFPLLLIEFLNIDERYPKLRLARFLHRYILFGFCLFLNIVTLFKMNSIWFSPYILVSGRKT